MKTLLLLGVLLAPMSAAFAQDAPKPPKNAEEYERLTYDYENWRSIITKRKGVELAAKEEAWVSLKAASEYLDAYKGERSEGTINYGDDVKVMVKSLKRYYAENRDAGPPPSFLVPSDSTGGAPLLGAGVQSTAEKLLNGSDEGEKLLSEIKADPAGTLDEIDDALALDPEEPDLMAIRARVKQETGDRAGAEEDARAALKLDPANKLARAVYRYSQEQTAAAGRATGAMKGAFDPKSGAGDAVASGGGYKPRGPAEQKAAAEALAAAAAGIKRGVTPGGQAQALIRSAVEKLSLGDVNGALFALSRALLLEPANVRARVLRAHISNLPKNKNYAAAIRDADEALKLEPGSAAAMFEKAYALLQLGNVAEALRIVEEGLRLEPGDAMGRFYHAMVLEKAGLIAQAIAEYRAAMAFDPALAPLVEEALARISAPPPGANAPGAGKKLPRTMPVKPVLLTLLVLTALALLLEGGKRLFYKKLPTAADALAAKATPAPSSTMSTLTPGDVLAGNFRIEKELARGGLGIVYRATDLKLKRPVAIKRLNREAYASPELRERFLKEAQLAARLRHQNLAEIFSIVGEEELCLVFELVEGETVHERLVRQGRLAVKEAARVVADAAAAIDYAHSQKVIHRDLKPANLMIGADGRTKVLDFGIAHETRGLSGVTLTQAWGTPPYMAPEQETGSVCRESDVYALGVVAYELIAGRRPYEGSYLLTMKIEKKYRPIHELAPGAPPELKAFFEKALEPDPEKRFHSAGELARALSAIEPTPVRA